MLGGTDTIRLTPVRVYSNYASLRPQLTVFQASYRHRLGLWHSWDFRTINPNPEYLKHCFIVRNGNISPKVTKLDTKSRAMNGVTVVMSARKLRIECLAIQGPKRKLDTIAVEQELLPCPRNIYMDQ